MLTQDERIQRQEESIRRLEAELSAFKTTPLGIKMMELIRERGEARDQLAEVARERDALLAQVDTDRALENSLAGEMAELRRSLKESEGVTDSLMKSESSLMRTAKDLGKKLAKAEEERDEARELLRAQGCDPDYIDAKLADLNRERRLAVERANRAEAELSRANAELEELRRGVSGAPLFTQETYEQKTKLADAVAALEDAHDGLATATETIANCVEERCVPTVGELDSCKAYLDDARESLKRLSDITPTSQCHVDSAQGGKGMDHGSRG